ncbi:FAD-binding oxidoreductase [Echinicola sp. CAU 1574]|uniref:FAD-binding oxidoreductase n=1 Tax=Echinicola arenosa TaxID=2774144 RepID=A0ABR9AGZ6_9BACT|nr:FAD-dependent oxidoreductase [Echinicola arenosa]MBD8487205.1 FAD-binding oxidoreductase [Echinicola arenosa]
MEVDFLLVGQGIAGTVLSYRLISSGDKVLVFDQAAQNNSSRVAAGLFNPVTGRKMVKTWNADNLFPEILPLYQELENLLNTKLIYLKKIYRPFNNIEEQNEWMGKSIEEGLQAYLEEVRTQPLYPQVNDPYGGIMLKNSGYLDINKLLDAYARWLKHGDLLRDEPFDEERLYQKEGKWHYKDIVANSLVYCNGLGAMKSKFFDWLPFAPVKGEILELESDFTPEEIINRGVFRITMPDKTIRVGSTYSWHDLDQGPTERGKEEIFERLEKIVPQKDKLLTSHKTGIRPATKDRKPFLGKHPESENVYIFNGFGAKGVSLVPYYSKIMLGLFEGKYELEKDVNISRFFKYI